ncbi:MAG: hypothetical protein N0E37_04665, partial [Candidatus Thiodiazotropha taylori]|nr:hypothetical protein [Candidatus Thiodiazotropha taylori]MCW4243711.1 hypothetical protein [Candidatus Thiodiazotropha taylori]
EAEAETEVFAESSDETVSFDHLDSAETPSAEDDTSDQQIDVDTEPMDDAEQPETEPPAVALSDEEQTPLKTEIDE